MTTDIVFNEWINTQPKINWKSPEEVRKLFIIWGDYVKDKYHTHELNSVKGLDLYPLLEISDDEVIEYCYFGFPDKWYTIPKGIEANKHFDPLKIRVRKKLNNE